MNSSATVTGCDHIERLLDMVAAPTPPVVLPPLPRAHHWLNGDLYRADQLREYGRACERAAYERAIKAVEDAGGDNAYYHADAIRALGADK